MENKTKYPKTMYRVGYKSQVDKLNVVRETELSIWFDVKTYKGDLVRRRELKNTLCHKTFNTFTEAKAYLIGCTEARHESLLQAMGKAVKAMNDAKNLREKDVD